MAEYSMNNDINVIVSNAIIKSSSFDVNSTSYVQTNPYNVIPKSDNGVFVGKNESAYYYTQANTNSTERFITKHAFGGIPIWPNTNPVLVGLVPTSDNWRFAGVVLKCIRTIYNGSALLNVREQWNGYDVCNAGGSVYAVKDYDDFVLSITKTEILDTFDLNTANNQHSYVTAFDVVINSSNHEPERMQMAFITLLPPGKESVCGKTISIGSFNYAHTTEPTFIIDGHGNILYTIDNGFDSVSPTTLSQAFPEEVIKASNTGIFAVSCLVATTTTTAWPCYKNGIYRIYNGSNELIGEPGERINIGKHEFVYFMHSSYAFRIP